MTIYLKSLWQAIGRLHTDEGVRTRYGERQKARPTEGNRTLLSMTFCFVIGLTLFSAMASLVISYRSERSFLKNQVAVYTFGNDDIVWKASNNGETFYEGTDLYQIANYPDQLVTDTGIVSLSATIPRAVINKVSSQFADIPTVLSLPEFKYSSGTAYVDGLRMATFYNNEDIYISLPSSTNTAADLRLIVEIKVGRAQRGMFNVTKDNLLVFVAQQPSMQKYAEFRAAKRTGAGKQLADIARVVLAIFCVLLFILVDSSPECLGLAMFMGFKAVGVILAQSWLPDWWTGSKFNFDIKNFMLCFGDIFQFYFFTQLSRLSKPDLRPWLLYGSIVSIFYAVLQHFDLSFLSIDGNREVWRWRNILIGSCCLFFATAAIKYTFRQKLYTRTAALVIASSGVFVQIFYPFVDYWPGVFNSDWFTTVYFVFETHTPYVFALSTFINISTLEQRVKSLSTELVLAKEIEREMELGQTVQRSLLRIPEIPLHMSVNCHHKPALYVSGDIYFINWDQGNSMLTALITDVTGHGVQAALKASICSTLAETIWTEQSIRATDPKAARLKIFDQRLHRYLSRMSQTEEMLSLIGMEFDLNTGRMIFYRVNGVYPVVMIPSKNADGLTTWQVDVLPIKNRETMDCMLVPGSLALLLSDGYLDSSRVIADFSKYLQDILHGREQISHTEAQQLILNFTGFSRSNDDKTLLIFRYNFALPAEAAMRRLG